MRGAGSASARLSRLGLASFGVWRQRIIRWLFLPKKGANIGHTATMPMLMPQQSVALQRPVLATIRAIEHCPIMPRPRTNRIALLFGKMKRPEGRLVAIWNAGMEARR